MRRLLFLLPLLLVLCPVAKGQVAVSGPQKEAGTVHNVASTLKGGPLHWTIFVVPDSAWSTHLAARNLEAVNHRQALAYSLVTEHLTYIRESTVYTKDLRLVLAHEASHVLCECLSEEIADKAAMDLLQP